MGRRELQMMFALAISALIAVAAPTTTWSTKLPAWHAAALPSFLGITMGEKAEAIDAKYGAPVFVKNVGDGEYRVYHLRPSDAALMVKVHDGLIVLVGATLKTGSLTEITDKYGVVLGAAAETIRNIRGSPIATLPDGSLEYDASPAGHWFYRTENGKVANISLTISYASLGLSKTDDASRDGSSLTSAIVITANTESDGITAEHDYTANHRCADGGAWQWTKQATHSAGGRTYDQIDVKCSTSDDTRSFFFDITSFFGKLGGQ